MTATAHPAKFSDSVLERIQKLFIEWGWPRRCIDPFAGVGKVHSIFEGHDTESIGVELEEEWAVQHPNNRVGNALALPFEDGYFDAMVTSPCYGNRLADHHEAKDGSKRYSYRHVLGRPLHPDNSGQLQWGQRYRDFHDRAWTEALRVLTPDALILINSSNHIRNGQEQYVTEHHLAWFLDHGCAVLDLNMVKTPRMRHGQNYKARASYENTFLLRRVAPVAVPDDIRDEEPSYEHSDAAPGRDPDLVDTAEGH